MIGFIGVGACGGNIANEAFKSGYSAIAINYSKSDLNSLDRIPESKKLHLIGSEGVGKNRDVAINLINNNWENILEFVKREIITLNREIIFIPFSMSGGTGSGLSPMLIEMLCAQFPNKTFVALPILPQNNEPVQNQLNFIQSSKELSKINICIIPIDNNKYYSMNKKDMYNNINNSFINQLNEIISYTKKSSKYGILDFKDFASLLSINGVTTIVKADLSDIRNIESLSHDGFKKIINNSWNNSIFITPDSIEDIHGLGVIFNGQQEFLNIFNIHTLFAKEPLPENIYEGYYFGDHGCTVIAILSGMPWNNNRMKNAERKVVTSNKNEINQKAYNFDFELTLNSEKEAIKTKSVTDIINKYKR